MSKPENPRAFPGPSALSDKGMALRDWFAGQALAGMVGNSGITMSFGQSHPESNETMATVAYCLADAMLAHRQQERPE